MLLRFRERLKSLGVLDTMKCYPSVFEPIFCYTAHRPLTATMMQELFVPTLLPAGSNRRQVENVTLSHWYDFLQNAKGMCTFVSC